MHIYLVRGVCIPYTNISINIPVLCFFLFVRLVFLIYFYIINNFDCLLQLFQIVPTILPLQWHAGSVVDFVFHFMPSFQNSLIWFYFFIFFVVEFHRKYIKESLNTNIAALPTFFCVKPYLLGCILPFLFSKLTIDL